MNCRFAGDMPGSAKIKFYIRPGVSFYFKLGNAVSKVVSKSEGS